MPVLIWSFAIGSILLSAFAQLAMKTGMNNVRQLGFAGKPLILSVITSPYVIGGLALYGLGSVLWLVVLSRVPLSMAYPLVSLGFIFVTILSWLFLGEIIPISRLVGIALIFAGVLFVGLS